MPAATAVPGDVVRHTLGDLVVVDVTGEGDAVLRRHHDLELTNPVPVTAGELELLEVVGHLGEGSAAIPPGWTETEHGVWDLS